MERSLTQDYTLPLVSILIPAYNRPQYLEQALKSALAQTYQNIEIVICDDSSNDEVESMLKPYLERYDHIKYYKNKKNLFYKNPHKCFKLSSGEYINYLMDDDLLHPQKIEKMLPYLLNHKKVKLVTSARYVIDDIKNISYPWGPMKKQKRIDGITLGNLALTTENIIGEPTTVLFRRKDLKQKFGRYKGKQYIYMNDMATWIGLLARGKAVYMVEPLSSFRLHPGQNSRNIKLKMLRAKEGLNLIHDVRKDGYLKTNDLYRAALKVHLEKCRKIRSEAKKAGNRNIARHIKPIMKRIRQQIETL